MPGGGRGKGKGKGRGRGRGRGKACTENQNTPPHVQETFADLCSGRPDPNAHQSKAAGSHVQESFADLCSDRPDPNAAHAHVDEPKPKRARKAKQPEHQATEASKHDTTRRRKPTAKHAPDTTAEQEQNVAAQQDQPAEKKPRTESPDQPALQVVPAEDDNMSTTAQPSEKPAQHRELKCWDKHAKHQQAKDVRREKAKAGVERIRQSGIPMLQNKIGEDFDRVNLN